MRELFNLFQFYIMCLFPLSTLQFLFLSLLLIFPFSWATSQNDTLNWQPPDKIAKSFPYFLSGHDKEGNPVWVVPFGAWNIPAVVNEGGETLENFRKYVTQMLQRFHNPQLYGKDADSFVVITNVDGCPLTQFFSVATISELSKLTTNFVEMDRLGRKVKVGYFVNVTYLFKALLDLARPLVGDLFNFAEMYGTNPDSWKPVLFRAISRDQLPPVLGGKYSHEFLETFG